jgi:hypothetical protein
VAAEFIQLAPVVTTGLASAATSTAATLEGRVNSRGVTTSACRFVYGPTAAYGSEAACEPGSVSGTIGQSVNATLSALTPHTTYHYKLVAANSGGETAGSDSTFQTAGSATELQEEAAAKQLQEQGGAASGTGRETEEAARVAESALENSVAANALQAIDTVLRRALEEEAAVRRSETPHAPPISIVAVTAGTRSVTLELSAAHGGSIRISGPALRTTRRHVAAGATRVTVALTSSGRRAHAHRKKIRIAVAITVAATTTSIAKMVRL